MNKYQASEAAYKNGYELGKKVMQEEFAEQFIKGFNDGVKDAGLIDKQKEEDEKNGVHI